MLSFKTANATGRAAIAKRVFEVDVQHARRKKTKAIQKPKCKMRRETEADEPVKVSCLSDANSIEQSRSHREEDAPNPHRLQHSPLEHVVKRVQKPQ